MDKKLLKIPDVARLLDVSEARARELARTKLIPSVRLGRQLRFDPEAIDAWIRGGGQALPGGWRREPKSTSKARKQQAQQRAQADADAY